MKDPEKFKARPIEPQRSSAEIAAAIMNMKILYVPQTTTATASQKITGEKVRFEDWLLLTANDDRVLRNLLMQSRQDNIDEGWKKDQNVVNGMEKLTKRADRLSDSYERLSALLKIIIGHSIATEDDQAFLKKIRGRFACEIGTATSW